MTKDTPRDPTNATGTAPGGTRDHTATPAVPVFGQTVDNETRCVHYHTTKDIVAIKFPCCGRYYPCHHCHEEDATHPARQWPATQWNEKAILCGACQTELTITEYRTSTRCPNCHAPFNERCANHAHHYFGQPPDSLPAGGAEVLVRDPVTVVRD
ncbi:CHY zinc finger protein [Arthrobacter sp. STN4]|uniref:CHY zinc finger protein n=1 Tax=Arthrobacter sp. STN4 TaxID=2923276 RepID=UPI00277B4BFB|nr:CHY zinc finger protein [Arthrobacter sp. STN4]